MSNKGSLSKLIACRNLLDAPELALLEEALNGRHQGACVSALINRAETVGLSGNVLRAVILYHLVHDKNIVNTIIERENGKIGKSLKEIFLHDMQCLFPYLNGEERDFLSVPFLKNYQPTNPLSTEASSYLAKKLENAATPEDYEHALLSYYEKYGYGDIASYAAFCWDDANKTLVGIPHFTAMNFDDLIGYEHQKEQLLENTAAFVAHKPANNVLLVGSRGTGKSSGVKALAVRYYEKGLRLLQLKKTQLKNLPSIMEILRDFASKRFIIFLDDLSFEESDAEYKYLKSAIEGGVSTRPENVLIYATSNRRHLIRENWSDRPEGQDAVHLDDSINETISLSDRFGLVIHYYAPDQNEYLAIIDHKLKKVGINLSPEELRIAGVRWEMTHSGRSGRTAEQFVAYFLGQKK